MDQQNENIEFKSTREYLDHWDEFFVVWKKNPKATFEEDFIWKNRKGTGEKKLEYDVLPQPYLGNIENHSVITLNLNPSRSRKNEENIEFEKNNLPKFKKAENYHEYAKGFPTYDIDFWQDQDDWINRIFEKLGKEKPPKEPEPLLPFAIEICPWGSKKFQTLKIDHELIKYMNEYVFDVIEKAIVNSKLKIVLSVGKAYYDIFEHKESGFRKIIECTKSQNSKAWDLKLDKDEEIKAELSKAFFEEAWPKKKENNEDLRYVNRSFSFWKKNGVIYFNSWSPGSNKPPGKEFEKIEEEFFRIYKSLIIKK